MNPPGSRFCNACGSPLGVTRPLGERPAPPPRPPTTAPLPPPPDVELAPGTTIDPGGRYVVRRTIGKGGFGEAYLVFDRQLNRFCVAKRQVPNPAWSARTRDLAAQNFVREAGLLVTLNTPGHPNIPEIYEYLPEQRCLVMKYVEGRDLGQILRERGSLLPHAESLAIVREVASALSYMHARRPEPVLHRDVKLSNILLDSSGRVWLIDFGLSRAIPAQIEIEARHTQLAGTLGFTPPEQWRGKAEPRSDVYALSATLHTMLTGFQPALTRAELPEFLSGALKPYPPPRSIDPSIHPDVESLLLRGLAFRPEERPSAAELLVAIDEFLMPRSQTNLQAPDGAAIIDEHSLITWAEANWDRATAWLYGNLPEQVDQFWGRNKLVADMRSAIARNPSDQHAGLDSLLTVLDPESFGAERPRLVADRLTLDFGSLALDERRDEWIMLSNSGRRYARVNVQAPRWVIPSVLTLNLPPGQRQRLKLTADMRRATESGKLRDVLMLKEHSGVSFRIEIQAQLSRWRAFWLRTVAGQRALQWEDGGVRVVRTINAHRGSVWALDFGPGGLELVSGGWDNAVRLWRASDGALLATLDERAGNVLSASFSPDGLLIAVTASDSDVKVWGARGGKLVRTLAAAQAYQESVHFSPDSQVLITNGNDATIRYWRLNDGALLQRIPTVQDAITLACRPDGQLLAVACRDRRVRIYDAERGALVATLDGHRHSVSSVAFSLDGSLLASGGDDGVICLWDSERAELRHQLRGHPNAVRTVAVHPDGLLVASGGVDGSIRLWRCSDGTLRQVLEGHASGVLRIAFSPTGDLLASGDSDGKVLLWQPG
jgi:WD40 repeat protein/serine/threonine protein kinase